MNSSATLKERPKVLFRENTRAPLEAPVQLQFDSYGELEEGFTADVSLGGMFVRNQNPKPVGTLLRFEVELAAGETAASGFAEVAWIRIRQTAFQKPSGMGIQFRYVDADSRRLLERAVRKAVRDLEIEPEPEASIEGATMRAEPTQPTMPTEPREELFVPDLDLEPEGCSDVEEAPATAGAKRPFGLSRGAIAILVPLALLALGLFLLL